MLPRAKVVLQSAREPPSIGLGPVGRDHEMTRRCTVPAPIGNPAKTGKYVAFSLETDAIYERQGCGFRVLCRAVSEVIHLERCTARRRAPRLEPDQPVREPVERRRRGHRLRLGPEDRAGLARCLSANRPVQPRLPWSALPCRNGRLAFGRCKTGRQYRILKHRGLILHPWLETSAFVTRSRRVPRRTAVWKHTSRPRPTETHRSRPTASLRVRS